MFLNGLFNREITVNDLRHLQLEELNRRLLDFLSGNRILRLDGLNVTIEHLLFTANRENFSTGVHQHPFYEFSLALDGSMKYDFNGFVEEIRADGSDMIFIPPYLEHRRHTGSVSAVIVGFQLLFQSEEAQWQPWLRDLPPALRRHDYHFRYPPETPRLLRQAYRELHRRRPFWQSRLSGLIQLFLTAFLRKNFPLPAALRTPPAGAGRGQYLNHLIERLLEEHPERCFSLDELARHCGISKRHLNRIYNAANNAGLGQRLRERRIAAAKRLLLDPGTQVKAVAAALDFGSASYFCRQFRQATGMSPEEYRQR